MEEVHYMHKLEGKHNGEFFKAYIGIDKKDILYITYELNSSDRKLSDWKPLSTEEYLELEDSVGLRAEDLEELGKNIHLVWGISEINQDKPEGLQKEEVYYWHKLYFDLDGILYHAYIGKDEENSVFITHNMNLKDPKNSEWKLISYRKYWEYIKKSTYSKGKQLLN